MPIPNSPSSPTVTPCLVEDVFARDRDEMRGPSEGKAITSDRDVIARATLEHGPSVPRLAARRGRVGMSIEPVPLAEAVIEGPIGVQLTIVSRMDPATRSARGSSGWT